MDRIRTKLFVALVALATFVLVLIPKPAEALSADVLITSINSQRSLRGLPGLIVDDQLTAKALSWSTYMASVGTISHSNLAAGITYDWKRLGENVGTGGTVEAIAIALINSPLHFANIVDPGFTHVGVAVVLESGRYFATEEFMELFTAPVPTAKPKPPPETFPPPVTTPIATIPPPTTLETTTTTTIPPPSPTWIPASMPTTIASKMTTTIAKQRLTFVEWLRRLVEQVRAMFAKLRS